MSLISDGLKKAQLEAMRRDEAQRKTYFGTGRLDTPRERRSSASVAIAAFAGAAVAAIALFAFMRNQKAPAAPASVPQQAVTKAAPVVTETMAVPRVETQPPAPTATATHAPAPVAIAAAVPAPVKKTPEPSRETRAETVAPPVKAERAPERAASEPAAETKQPARNADAQPSRERQRDRFIDGKSYASPINAPGGMEISLSGVSSIGGKSAAIINGVVLREGSTVGPFVVETIERGRVQLRYIDVRFWLTY